MKTSKVKKVLYVLIISLFIAVTIATVVLAVVPKELYNPINDNFGAVSLYKDGDKIGNLYKNTEGNSEHDREVIANIMELHNSSVKDNLLSTIFQGTGSFEERVVYEESTTNCKDSVATKSGVVCLVFDYVGNEQTLTINGTKYTHPEAKGEGKTIVYTKIFMEVSNTQDFQQCKIYLADSSNKSNFQVEFLAHQSDLYDYLVNLNVNRV